MSRNINPKYQRTPKPHQSKQIFRRDRSFDPLPDLPDGAPKAYNLPEYVPTNTLVPKESDDSMFRDPWNCQRCRDIGTLCQMHQELTEEGVKPRGMI